MQMLSARLFVRSKSTPSNYTDLRNAQSDKLHMRLFWVLVVYSILSDVMVPFSNAGRLQSSSVTAYIGDAALSCISK
eukprot:64943-Amphidinium_carterae.1